MHNVLILFLSIAPRLLGGDPPPFLEFLFRSVSIHAEGEDFPPTRVKLFLWVKRKTSGGLQQNSGMMDDL